jgi:ABC-type Fe3+-hydroxamate transport system substrate-binding protein
MSLRMMTPGNSSLSNPAASNPATGYLRAMILLRRSALLILVLGLFTAACSSSGGDTSTTASADSTTTSTVDPEAFVAAQMCRTLELLSRAGTPPGHAAEAMTATDTADMTSTEKVAYADLIVSAPATDCPEQQRYAEAVAYWLGF